MDQLRSNYNKVDLNNVDKRLCQLAKKLTLNPNSIDEEKYITPLKNMGLSDRRLSPVISAASVAVRSIAK